LTVSLTNKCCPAAHYRGVHRVARAVERVDDRLEVAVRIIVSVNRILQGHRRQGGVGRDDRLQPTAFVRRVPSIVSILLISMACPVVEVIRTLECDGERRAGAEARAEGLASIDLCASALSFCPGFG